MDNIHESIPIPIIIQSCDNLQYTHRLGPSTIFLSFPTVCPSIYSFSFQINISFLRFLSADFKSIYKILTESLTKNCGNPIQSINHSEYNYLFKIL